MSRIVTLAAGNNSNIRFNGFSGYYM